MPIKSVMPSNHPILCHPFLLLPSIFPSIRFFSNESVLHIRWPKYWSFSFSISPSNEYKRYFLSIPKFQYVMFTFPYISNYCLISLVIFSLTYCLFRNMLLNFRKFIGFWIFFCYWAPISFHHDQRIFFVLLQPFYIYWDMVYPGDCSMCTWEECIFLCRWIECSISARSSSYIALFCTNISLFFVLLFYPILKMVLWSL